MAERTDTVASRLGSLETAVRGTGDGVARVERALERHSEEMRVLHRDTLERVARLEEQRIADTATVTALTTRVAINEEVVSKARAALTILKWVAGIIGSVVVGLALYVVKLRVGQ